MKGRPVTGEELWKLLKATRRVVGPKVAKHYRRLLVGCGGQACGLARPWPSGGMECRPGWWSI